MANFEYTVEFSVECSECGADLDTSERYSNGLYIVEVDSCQDCLQAATTTAHEEGKAEGREEAEKDG